MTYNPLPKTLDDSNIEREIEKISKNIVKWGYRVTKKQVILIVQVINVLKSGNSI
jgi:hypothetical protein